MPAAPVPEAPATLTVPGNPEVPTHPLGEARGTLIVIRMSTSKSIQYNQKIQSKQTAKTLPFILIGSEM